MTAKTLTQATVLMLDLLKNIENVLLTTLWCISGALILISILVALWLSFRRVYRNNQSRYTLTRQTEFEQFLQHLLTQETFPADFELPSNIRADRTAITAGLLKFFKLVRGDDALKLKIIVDKLRLEPVVQNAITWGNRGKRLRAFHVLSFLDSSSSLKTISEYLYSTDKYIRLSVARCIARRRVMSLISEVSESVAYAFPNDPSILADVLYRFGRKAVPRIEGLANHSTNSTVIAGVLETLILLRPETTQLNLTYFIKHTDERVRAAAETFADLYRLMNDPFMWVRYWAMQAALNVGHSGQTLMRALSRQSGGVADLAVDVLKER